ncbi:5'-methylthioadenosine/adenosylhomocysteine nucleosidase [Buchnera aphidicola]|uniref:5'-methylthioadenosine/adenosylhomocysteine nucleosidase n=1 Tax=Buchnera aphidicola TaxID=9 RepID=UPI003BEF21AC
MKIGIIGAIQEEIKKFKNLIQYYKKDIVGYTKIYIGEFKNFEIILIQSGIGKVSASVATTILINLYKPKYIINIGSAGSLDSMLKIGDIIIPTQICYHDVDLVNFGYSFGQIPGFPAQFHNNTILCNLLKDTAIKYKFNFFCGLLISGDSFIRKDNFIKTLHSKFSTAIAVEMESASIAQVCHQFNMPFIIVKYISDTSDNTATVQFKKNVYTTSFSLFHLIKKMLENMIDITILSNLNI